MSETKNETTVRTGTRQIEFVSALDSKVPSGPIEQRWDKHRFEMKLVNPANRRKYTIIVVGSGLAGVVRIVLLPRVALTQRRTTATMVTAFTDSFTIR
jgi:hypothetical protein